MNSELWCIGKTKDDYLKMGIAHYLKKLKYYTNIKVAELTPQKTKSAQQQIINEEKLVLSRLKNSDYLIGLEEKGKQYDSIAFAQKMDQWQMSGAKRLVFLIGGPFGHSRSVRQRFDARLSLSTFTFTHDMARLILLEQIYRAMTILKNEPYHNK